MADQDKAEGAKYLDEYSRLVPADWQSQYLRGVAHANARVGKVSDEAALDAYDKAFALAPLDLASNDRARLHIYRAAILKRLNRLGEAVAELRIAESQATRSYERQDLLYNYACIYAMTGRTDEAMRTVRQLKGSRAISAVRAHQYDYFHSLRDDPELRGLMNIRRSFLWW